MRVFREKEPQGRPERGQQNRQRSQKRRAPQGLIHSFR
jgi:hypothetical protein